MSTVVEDHEQKSELECFAESVLFMSMADVLAMGYGWENARGCKLEHEIAKAYHVEIVYLDELKKGLSEWFVKIVLIWKRELMTGMLNVTLMGLLINLMLVIG